MPRTCTICTHCERELIERDLLAGESLRNIAKRFGTSPTALFRHKAEHLSASLVKAHEVDEVLRADNLLEYMGSLHGRTELILSSAMQAGDLRAALAAIREARDNVAFVGQLAAGRQSQEGQPETPANIMVNIASLIGIPRASVEEREDRRRRLALETARARILEDAAHGT